MKLRLRPVLIRVSVFNCIQRNYIIKIKLENIQLTK